MNFFENPFNKESRPSKELAEAAKSEALEKFKAFIPTYWDENTSKGHKERYSLSSYLSSFSTKIEKEGHAFNFDILSFDEQTIDDLKSEAVRKKGMADARQEAELRKNQNNQGKDKSSSLSGDGKAFLDALQERFGEDKDGLKDMLEQYQNFKEKQPNKNDTLKQLQEKEKIAVDVEDYELAAKIRDQIADLNK